VILTSMDVILSDRKADVQECEVLVSGFFEDERPLRGTSGWLDWRLNGVLSRFLIQKRLIGAWKETILIPSQGRVSAPLILLIGLGRVREYSYLRLRDLLPFVLDRLQKLSVSKVCFSLPEDEEHQVEPGKMAEVLMEEIADAAGEPSSGKEGWAEELTLYFAGGEGCSAEILLGLQTAQSILQDRLDIQILLAQNDPRKDLTFEK